MKPHAFRNMARSLRARLFSPLGAGALLVPAIAAIMLVSYSPAWSFEQIMPGMIKDGADQALPLIVMPSPPASSQDHCLSLLPSARFDGGPGQGQAMAMDRDQRAVAGQAAALGLVVGVRFALGPKQVHRPGRNGRVQFGAWEPSNNGAQALAVSAYRRCKNEQAINALSN